MSAPSGSGDPRHNDPVASYLDTLARSLSGAPDRVERVLAEAEAHLHDAVDAHRRGGRSDPDAVEAALRDYGTVAQVAAAANKASWARVRAATLLSAAGVMIRLTATGMLLAGIIAVASQLVAALTSVQAVFGLPTGARTPTGDCGYWLSIHPDAASCQQAATLEAAGDLPQALGALGILGLLLWGIVVLVERLTPPRSPVLPRVLEPALGLALFAALAAGTAVLGAADAVLFTTWGAGLWWTATACALLTAFGFGWRLWTVLARNHLGARQPVLR